MEAAPSKEEFDLMKQERDQMEASLLEEKQININYAQEKSKLILQISELKEANLKTKEESKNLEDLKTTNENLKNELEAAGKTALEAQDRLENEVNIFNQSLINMFFNIYCKFQIKSLIQAEKRQKTAFDESQAEVGMLRKQLKSLNVWVSTRTINPRNGLTNRRARSVG